MLVTLSEGLVSELHVGLSGTMGALYLRQLAEKTHRGLRGRVETGCSGGGNSYGYEVARKAGPNGELEAGRRTVNQLEAEIVCQIFQAYSLGEAPRSISKRLNREGIAGPSGGTWGPSTINGNPKRGTGVLNNELYIGKLVWNRLKYVKNPNTGKRQSRLNPPETWIIKEVPELRIVPQELWDAVKARQAQMARATRPDRKKADFWKHQRPRYLLSGLMKCGACGASYTKYGANRFMCAGARDRATCSNHLTVRGDDLEHAILHGLQTRLMEPALFEEFAREFMSEVSKQRFAASAAKAALQSDIQRIERQIKRLVDAILEGADAKPINAKLKELEADKVRLAAALNALADDKPLLHPDLAAIYRTRVESLEAALRAEQRDFQSVSSKRQPAAAVAALQPIQRHHLARPQRERVEERQEGRIAPVDGSVTQARQHLGQQPAGQRRCRGEHDEDKPEYYLWHPVDQNELDALKKEDRRRFSIDDVLITDKVDALWTAVANFVTAGAIRRLNQRAESQRPKHYAMIVHVETSRSAHAWQHQVTVAVLDKMKAAIAARDPIADRLIDAAIADLRRSVEAEGLKVPDRDELVKEIRDSFAKGAVATEKVNSDNDVEALLDEHAELKLRTPYNVFIGGQILDRGITVPNLLGFYYGRSPKKMQQDTVLQHARMYGARPRPDLAVTRFYTTPSNHAALRRIHQFDSALRDAFMKGAHDRGVAFILKDVTNRVTPCAPSKILMSEITSLRPGRAFLPVGFQTKARTSIAKIVEKIDRLVPVSGKNTQAPVKVTTEDVIALIDLIEGTLDDYEVDPFDWKAMRGAVEYYSRIAAPEKDRGKCWLLAETDREIVRVRTGGRFSNAPHTKQQEAIVQQLGDRLPIIMLFRQNGEEAKGWRGAPFWWPVLFPPLRSAPAVFAESVSEEIESENENSEAESV
jgi:Z1 domain/Recombinase/Recombinase zinc beta ribbon domain